MQSLFGLIYKSAVTTPKKEKEKMKNDDVFSEGPFARVVSL
jgi:hypothetical protein